MNTRTLFGDDVDARDDTGTGEAGKVTLTLAYHRGAGACVVVSEDGNAHNAVLLPRSQIRLDDTGKTIGGLGCPKLQVFEVTMPEWLAKDRRLI